VNLASRWNAAAGLVAEHRDVLDARPDGGDAPPALTARGWADFLLGLEDHELAALEIAGHDAAWPTRTPASLRDLAQAARDVCALPALSALSAPSPDTPDVARRPAARRLETPRKRAQIEAFAQVIFPLARAASRIVDVGSGHGHLTRDIAERIARPVLGLERDVALASRARTLPSSAPPSFAVTDVLLEGLPLSASDCVIGLHACGELGDVMVETAARTGAAIALVGCCLQKQRAMSRAPLRTGAAAPYGDALHLPRSMLGLSNLTARDDGVEASRAQNLAGRERRLALHRLLSEAGVPLRLGAEIDGLNRRAAQRDLAALVARAFTLRARPVPPTPAIEAAASWARDHHARQRRLSLPRALLARVLEVLVLADRAGHLEEHGRVVTIGLVFPASVSARNLVLVAPSA
jgi:hypothetical protein